MKKSRAASAMMVRMKVVLRASLLRACVDSTTPTDTPVSTTASGAATHQRSPNVAAAALAASIDSAPHFSHPAILM